MKMSTNSGWKKQSSDKITILMLLMHASSELLQMD